MLILLFLSVVFLSFTNGANDNFKGAATLYGSGVLNYRQAISIVTVATFLGSIASIFLAQGLIDSFSGKGLVPQEIAETSQFLTATAAGAGFTVFVAALRGLPISTTHSLVGGLTGAGFMAVGADVNFSALGSAFLIPLLASPFIAFALSIIVYSAFKFTRKSLGLQKEPCICIGNTRQFVPVRVMAGIGTAETNRAQKMMQSDGKLTVTLADTEQCVDLYTGHFWGVPLQKMLDAVHVLSGATVSFARGLNDAPKIAGLLVASAAFDLRWNILAISTAMAIGGILGAKKVAQTMSLEISDINHGQGFSANLVTSFLVIVASRFGVPVSTTHVSVGSIFGIGAISGKANIPVIRNILLSWVVVLPASAIFSALVYSLITL